MQAYARGKKVAHKLPYALLVSLTVLIAGTVTYLTVRANVGTHQIAEQDGKRTTELRAFGFIPIPATPDKVRDLEVSKDALSQLKMIGQPAPGVDLAAMHDALRVIRPQEKAYYATVPFSGDRLKAANYYAKILRTVDRSDPLTITGYIADGAKVTVCFDDLRPPNSKLPPSKDCTFTLTRQTK